MKKQQPRPRPQGINVNNNIKKGLPLKKPTLSYRNRTSGFSQKRNTQTKSYIQFVTSSLKSEPSLTEDHIEEKSPNSLQPKRSTFERMTPKNSFKDQGTQHLEKGTLKPSYEIAFEVEEITPRNEKLARPGTSENNAMLLRKVTKGTQDLSHNRAIGIPIQDTDSQPHSFSPVPPMAKPYKDEKMQCDLANSNEPTTRHESEEGEVLQETLENMQDEIETLQKTLLRNLREKIQSTQNVIPVGRAPKLPPKKVGPKSNAQTTKSSSRKVNVERIEAQKGLLVVDKRGPYKSFKEPLAPPPPGFGYKPRLLPDFESKTSRRSYIRTGTRSTYEFDRKPPLPPRNNAIKASRSSTSTKRSFASNRDDKNVHQIALPDRLRKVDLDRQTRDPLLYRAMPSPGVMTAGPQAYTYPMNRSEYTPSGSNNTIVGVNRRAKTALTQTNIERVRKPVTKSMQIQTLKERSKARENPLGRSKATQAELFNKISPSGGSLLAGGSKTPSLKSKYKSQVNTPEVHKDTRKLQALVRNFVGSKFELKETYNGGGAGPVPVSLREILVERQGDISRTGSPTGSINSSMEVLPSKISKTIPPQKQIISVGIKNLIRVPLEHRKSFVPLSRNARSNLNSKKDIKKTVFPTRVQTELNKLRQEALPVIWIFGYPQAIIASNINAVVKTLAEKLKYHQINMERQIVAWKETPTNRDYIGTVDTALEAVASRAKRMLSNVGQVSFPGFSTSQVLELIELAMVSSRLRGKRPKGFIIRNFPTNTEEGEAFEARLYPSAVGVYFLDKQWSSNKNHAPECIRPKYFLRKMGYSEKAVEEAGSAFGKKTLKVTNAEALEGVKVQEAVRMIEDRLFFRKNSHPEEHEHDLHRKNTSAKPTVDEQSNQGEEVQVIQ